MTERETKKETIEIDSWYKVEFLDNNIVAIGEPHHGEEVFCYLVRGKDQDLLIDTGMGVVSILLPLGKIPNRKPLQVINTHAHFDHIGGNKHFDKVWIPYNSWEINIILKGTSHEELEIYGFTSEFSKIPEGFDHTKYKINPYFEIRPVLLDQTVIDLGERRLQIIATPGHTPGSISIFEEDTGILFTSDLLYDGPLYCYAPETDFNLYFQSIKSVKALKDQGLIKKLHPGHNYSEGKPELIDEAFSLFQRAQRGDSPDVKTKDYLEYHLNDFRRIKLRMQIS